MIPALVLAYDNLNGIQNRLSELKELGSPQIYVFLDGFDEHLPLSRERSELVDFLNTMETRGQITGLYQSDTNLGVGVAVPSALDWFFSNVEYGLILEDDCRIISILPSLLETIPQETISSSLICLSNPKLNSDQFEVKFLTSPFFSSWGWICNREIWRKNRVTALSLRNVVTAVLSIHQLTFMKRLLLLIAWTDVWLTLRRNQSRLWAFRFSVILILNGQDVLYSSLKAIQHQPSGFGVNVRSNPSWDCLVPNNFHLLARFPKFQVIADPTLNDYIATNVHGASIRSLLLRFGFRFLEKLKKKL